MRKVILSVNVTLDGYIAGPDGELDWMTPDPIMNREYTGALRGQVDTILLGRNVYAAFEANFRRKAADPSSPPAGRVRDLDGRHPDGRLLAHPDRRQRVSRVAAGEMSEEVAAEKARPGESPPPYDCGIVTLRYLAA